MPWNSSLKCAERLVLSTEERGTATFAQSIFLRSLKKPRRHFTLAQKNEVRERQKDLCECGEELGDSPELDHIQPLAQGGSDSIDNVEFVCSTCHLKKTELERLGGGCPDTIH